MSRTLSTSALSLFLVLIFGPIVYMLGHSFFYSSLSDNETWTFILDSMFWDLLKNTFSLAFVTVLFTSVIGFSQAFIISFSNIGRKGLLHLIFVMPLIFPLYVFGFVFVGSLEYSGYFPTMIREVLGLNILKLVDIKSTLGVSFVFSLALSPYIYLYLKSAFESMDSKVFLSARSLGKNPYQIVKTIVIPQALPWLFSGAILVCLEVFCDFGGVSVFNYETFSTAIYHAWISLFSINTAIKLSVFPTAFALGLYFYNQYKFKIRENVKKRESSTTLLLLSGWKKYFVKFLIGLYFIISIGFPVLQLIFWGMESIAVELNSNYFLFIGETFIIGAAASSFIVIISLIFIYFQRHQFGTKAKLILPFSKTGYALPGSIIAVSIMGFFANVHLSYAGGFALAALLLAYVIKFYSVSSELLVRGMSKIPTKMDWSSLSLGKTSSQTFFKVQLPILKPIVLSSFIMILIEVFKEMPMTLILRPFGVNTLATRIYELTSEGEWERASVSALFLLALGALSLYISERVIRKK